MSLMYSTAHFSEDASLFIHTCISRVNLISPLRSFSLYFFYLFIILSLALISQKTTAAQRGFAYGKTRSREWTGTGRGRAVWALGITATASSLPPAVRGNIFQSFSIASSSPPFLGVSTHVESFFSSSCDSFLNLPIQRRILIPMPFKNKPYIFYANV